MIIERIELRHLSLPLKESFTTSYETKNHIEHVLVTVYSNGLIGWGECTCNQTPYYINETTETAWYFLRKFIIPYILGEDINTIDDVLQNKWYKAVRGNFFAKAGLEMAVWDLLAKRDDKSLAAMIGGTRSKIHSGVSIGVQENTATLCQKIEKYINEGYQRIKIKIKPGKDYEVLKAVRDSYSALPIMADANSAYTLDDLPLLLKLDELSLMMIEQPLGFTDIVDHAVLQAKLKTPVCLDESIHSAEDARKAISLGSCRIINIKIGRVGGFAEAKKIHDLCQAFNVPVWCGGMHEYGIGRAFNVAICSLPNFTLPGDVSGSDKYWDDDIISPPFIIENGAIAVPTKPGIGVEPLIDKIQKHTLCTEIFDLNSTFM